MWNGDKPIFGSGANIGRRRKTKVFKPVARAAKLYMKFLINIEHQINCAVANGVRGNSEAFGLCLHRKLVKLFCFQTQDTELI